MLKHLEKAVHNAGFGKPIPSVLGLDNLQGAWYHTDQNTLENIFYARMRTYACRVETYEESDLVYVPYFGGHDSLRNMHKDILSRDRLAHELVPYLMAQPSWQRRNGSDHFMVLGRNVWDFNRKWEHRGWGSRLIPMDGVKGNMWVIVVETNEEVTKEVVSAPKPTSFHPQSLKQLREWQEFVRTRERTSLFSFAAGHRPLKTSEGILREKLFWPVRELQALLPGQLRQVQRQVLRLPGYQPILRVLHGGNLLPPPDGRRLLAPLGPRRRSRWLHPGSVQELHSGGPVPMALEQGQGADVRSHPSGGSQGPRGAHL